MITYLHLIIHYLLMLISMASLLVPLFIKNKLELTKLQDDLNRLKQLIGSLDNKGS